jgi:uncharacterized RmlC-like cupin family protein
VAEQPTVVDPSGLVPSAATPGIERWTAFDDNPAWIGLARTDPQSMSSWHVHPGHDTYVFVVTGGVQIDFGQADADRVIGDPGSFVKIPQGVVHREGNPTNDAAELVVVRFGSGPLVVNVDAPASNGDGA